MPVQLMRSKAERAQCPATDWMTSHPSNANRPPRGHSYSQAASIGAQRARRLLHFDRTARRLRNPRPVLAPNRGVIQQFPRYRRDHQTRRRSRAPEQKISSRDLHASPLQLLSLFMATKAAHLNVATSMTAFAVAHLHALVRRSPQAQHGMPPDI